MEHLHKFDFLYLSMGKSKSAKMYTINWLGFWKKLILSCVQPVALTGQIFYLEKCYSGVGRTQTILPR